tara:strand:+ start:1400 stop:1639 length:240 start_codon:yes stop_codon:yes gene_type:complete
VQQLLLFDKNNMRRSRVIRINNREELLIMNKDFKYHLEDSYIDYNKNPCIYEGLYNGWDYREDIKKDQFRVVSFNNYKL